MWCAMITGTGREEQMQRACERHIDNKALLSKCFLPLKQELRLQLENHFPVFEAASLQNQ